jgi:tetratricopeptide (TPR) repeat protein
MSHPGRLLGGLLLLGVLCATGAGRADAFDLFPDAVVLDAHQMRQRVQEAIPDLELSRLRGRAKLPSDSLAAAAERLAGLEPRDAANPFLLWARGELTRRTKDREAAQPFFERAVQAAGAKAVVHWMLWQEFLARGLWREAERHEQALLTLQMRAGLTEAPLLSDTLLAAARHAMMEGDAGSAAALFTRVLTYDPDRSDALAGRAGARWSLGPAGILGVPGDVVRSLVAGLRDRLIAGRLISNLLLGLMTAWLLCLLIAAGIAALKSHALFLHDLKEGPLRSFLPAAQWSLSLLLLLLPLMLGLGLLWTAAAVLVITAPYFSRRERIVVSVLLCGLAVMPMGYRWIAREHILAASPRLATSLTAERGGMGDSLLATLTSWRTDNPSSGLAAYYLGLVQKRRGDLTAAETAMAEAVKLRPHWSFAHTGLGNIQFLAGKTAEAEASYRRADAVHPSFASAANLGALYAVQVEVEKSSEWLTKSQRLDGFAAGRVARAGLSGGVVAVMDERMQGSMLASGLGEEDEHDAVAEGFWVAPLRGIRLGWLPGVAFALLAAFWGHATLRGARVARRCQECGTPFCTHCHADYRERSYCSPCTPVFRDREGVPAMVKLARFREADGWVRRERLWTAWLGTLVPGGGWWYLGGAAALPVSLLSLWALLEGILLDLLAPSLRFVSPLPSSLRAAGALLVVVALQGLSAWRSRRRPASGSREARQRALRGESGGGRESDGYAPLSMRD